MKGYSSANLLLIENQERGFIRSIFHGLKRNQTVRLSLQIPTSVYERSVVFCKDVEELSGLKFDEATLMNLLYHDFLIAVKKNQNMKKWYTLLLDADRMTRPLQVFQNNQEVDPFFPNLLSKQEKRKSPYRSLILLVKYQHLLRGEWFLRDLEEVAPEHGFTVEKILEILYCDFIYKHQRGETSDVVNRIIQHLGEEDEQ